MSCFLPLQNSRAGILPEAECLPDFPHKKTGDIPLYISFPVLSSRRLEALHDVPADFLVQIGIAVAVQNEEERYHDHAPCREGHFFRVRVEAEDLRKEGPDPADEGNEPIDDGGQRIRQPQNIDGKSNLVGHFHHIGQSGQMEGIPIGPVVAEAVPHGQPQCRRIEGGGQPDFRSAQDVDQKDFCRTRPQTPFHAVEFADDRNGHG